MAKNERVAPKGLPSQNGYPNPKGMPIAVLREGFGVPPIVLSPRQHAELKRANKLKGNNGN